MESNSLRQSSTSSADSVACQSSEKRFDRSNSSTSIELITRRYDKISTSSGYSSPEDNYNKETSPMSSGPPSPAYQGPHNSRPMVITQPNITVIQINTPDSPDQGRPPPRPPKSIKFRHSTAADFAGSLRPLSLPLRRRVDLEYHSDEKKLPMRSSVDQTSSVALPDIMRDMTLDERFCKKETDNSRQIPRVVDAQPKKIPYNGNKSRAEVFAEDGRTSVLPRLRMSHHAVNHMAENTPDLSELRQEIYNNTSDENLNAVLEWKVGQMWKKEREKELCGP